MVVQKAEHLLEAVRLVNEVAPGEVVQLLLAEEVVVVQLQVGRTGLLAWVHKDLVVVAVAYRGLGLHDAVRVASLGAVKVDYPELGHTDLMEQR